MNATLTTSSVQFRKTRDGEWAVFGPRGVLAGNIITAKMIADNAGDEWSNLPRTEVTLKNGGVKMAFVRAVSKGFDVDGEEFAYGYLWEGYEIDAIENRAFVR